MGTLFRTFVTALLAYTLRMYLPWWAIAVAACVVGIFLGKSILSSFISGFFGIAVLWMVYASFQDISSFAIISKKIVELIGIKNIALLIIFIGIIGGVVGGFASMLGFAFKKIISR